jgi:hypothetical protein
MGRESLWWGELKDAHPESSTFRGRLLDGKSTWVFADVQVGQVKEDSHRVLVLVSDDPNAYASFVKHKDGVVLCMRIPGRTERGDCLFHLGSDYKPAAPAAAASKPGRKG